MTLDEHVQLGAIRDTELEAHGVGQVSAAPRSFLLQVLSDRHLRERERERERERITDGKQSHHGSRGMGWDGMR